MENMYQQAILDAKSLRASAMANAKSALQEAFEPKIQEMVRLKLSEELEEVGDQLEEDENLEDGVPQYEGDDNLEEVDDAELEEILAELNSLSEDDDVMEEDGEYLNEAEDDDTKETDTEETDDEETEDDEFDTEEETFGDDESLDGEEETVNITIGIDQLADQLGPYIDKINKAANGSKDMVDTKPMGDDAKEKDISLDEILAELEEEEGKKIEETKTKNELKEAKRIIKVLHESLTEVNLLNAKLLYMNKIFKSKSLTESQKVNVVKSFDKASSVKEVKYTYEIIKESMTVSKKSPIRESFGYASKPAGMSPNANVIEADSFISRWQKIAGI